MAPEFPVTTLGRPRHTLWWHHRHQTKMAAELISGHTCGDNIFPSFTSVRQSQNINRTIGSDKACNESQGLCYLCLSTNGMENSRRILTHSILLYICQMYVRHSQNLVRNTFVLVPSVGLIHPFYILNAFTKIPLHQILYTSPIYTKLTRRYFVRGPMCIHGLVQCTCFQVYESCC